MNGKVCALVVGAVGLAGCATSLKVERAEPGPQSGVLYVLPMTTFDITVTHRIASCDDKTGVMKIAEEFQVARKSLPDPDNTFSIDVRSLHHFFNTATTDIKFHSDKDAQGNPIPTPYLKTFNATVTDNTGPAVLGFAKAIAGLESLPSATGGAAADLKCMREPGPNNTWIETTAMLVTAAKKQEQDVKDLSKLLEQQTLIVARLSALQAARLPGRDSKLDQQLADAIRNLSEQKSQLEAEEKELARRLKPITNETKISWPENGKDRKRTEAIAFPRKTLEAWAGKSALPEGVEKELDVYVSLERLVTAPCLQLEEKNPDKCTLDTLPPKAGLYYRTAAPGNVVFRRTQDEQTALQKIPQQIAQLGFINSLPIEAQAFESVSFSAELSMDGQLVAAGYTPTASASAAVSALLSGTVDQYVAVEKAKTGEVQAELDAQLKKIAAEIAIEEAKKKLNPPAKTADETALAAMNAETILLNAQIARLEAEKKLAQLKDN